MARNTPERLEPHIIRRCLGAFAREYHAPRPVTHAEASHIEAVTIGERINFEIIAALYGRNHADNWKARLGL